MKSTPSIPRATQSDKKALRMSAVVHLPNGIQFPMHTSRGQNAREHHMTRARRVKREKESVQQWLTVARMPRTLPAGSVVTLTRIAPGNGMDDDGVVGSMKSIRDAVATWIGVDDKHSSIVRYAYTQARGGWGVRIEWGA